MYSNETTIARKYVTVLNRVYAQKWSIVELEKLEDLKQLLGTRNGILSYLRLDCIAEKRKYELIMKALVSFELADMLEPLLFLLQRNKHLSLLFMIVTVLIAYIKKQLKVEDITIYTAYELAQADRGRLEEWIKKERDAAYVRSLVIIKPDLMAGFRIEGNGFTGDYSVYNQLRKVKYICKKEGHYS